MKRREFLKIGTGALAAHLAIEKGFAEKPQPPPQPMVRTVYVVALCHLDLGFTDFEYAVIRKYFEDYIPTAIDTARKLQRENADERYVWTLSSWMVYEYLEQASSENRRNMEQALSGGQIAWHAMPFTWESELLDRSLMGTSFGLSKALDQRFGIRTIAGKLTDVPGHTRGLIGPAVEAGIQFIDIGPNVHSPDVPPAPHLFNWRDPEGKQVTVLYHEAYGGTTVIPGTDVAVAINVRGDNKGPHPVSEIQAYYADLRRQFPNATIVATNLNTVAKAVRPIRDRIPLVTEEIGDTWIYCVGSDPVKMARYRELSRLRLEWLSRGAFQLGDPVDLAFSSKLILATEHNGGLHTGRNRTPGALLDYPHVFTPDELADARANNPVFQKYDLCWAEKRADLDKAVEDALPQPLRVEAQQRLHSLIPVAPEIHHLNRHATGRDIKTAHFVLSIDPKTGAIHRLLDRKTGREWASPTHPLALFRYQTFDSADCKRYVHQYAGDVASLEEIWGKPGVENYAVESRVWEPTVSTAYFAVNPDAHRIISELQILDVDPKLAKFVSWPNRLMLEIVLPKNSPEIKITLWCLDKRANRLPEAMWFSFSPDAPSQEGWRLEKVNRFVSPLDVMSHGGRHLHAVTRQVNYRDDRGAFMLETLDAPLVAPGQRLLTNFNNSQPDMREGVHVNLFNNLWNTAFPQWYGDDVCFRFVMSFPNA